MQPWCIHANSHKPLVLLWINLVVLLNELSRAHLPARDLQGNTPHAHLEPSNHTLYPHTTPHMTSHHTSHPNSIHHAQTPAQTTQTHLLHTSHKHPTAQKITSFLRAVDSAMRESFCAASCLRFSLRGASSSSSAWDFPSAADSYSAEHRKDNLTGAIHRHCPPPVTGAV